MKDFDPSTFGQRHADVYDVLSVPADTDECVAFLAELAGEGPALELAIGTGRVALPLAARGVRVDGIELSPAMVEQLRAKPGGPDLDVTLGDMASTERSGRYPLVYLVYNTLPNLLTQDDQVRCVENAARHLTDDGVFVLEVGVPWALQRNTVEAERIDVDSVVLNVERRDLVTQLLDESHVVLTEEGIRLYPVVTRYVWPSELDLMARLAGLRLLDRWGGWQREPFTSDSRTHVSVYGR